MTEFGEDNLLFGMKRISKFPFVDVKMNIIREYAKIIIIIIIIMKFPVYESENTAVGDPSRWPHGIFYPQSWH
jgi:hypothetical protein